MDDRELRAVEPPTGRGSDLAKLDEIYRAEGARITRAFRHRVGGTEEARDFVQDIFVLLISYGKDNQILEPRALLSRLIRNKISDISRRIGRYSDLQFISIENGYHVGLPASQSHAIEAEDMMRQYQKAVDALAPRTREVFLRHRVNEQSYREIADQLGISIRTVEWHVAEALSRIARALED